MKNKIVAIIFVFSLLFNLQVSASEFESEQLPKWVTVDYANLTNQSVSEYQLVTVTVSNYGLWFTTNEYNVSVDYNPSELELVNTTYTDSMQNRTVKAGSNVYANHNNFEVSYQFYLMPNVDVEMVPITITKEKNNRESETATVNLSAFSDTTQRNVSFGDITLSYDVTEYNNDGTNIEYNIHFKVIKNPNHEPFTLSLKKNNMSISDSDIYQAKLRFDSGSATAIDKNNFKLTMNKGDNFDLNITTTVSGLTAKDDRFDFFIYLQTGDHFARLSPIYYRSELLTDATNTRVVKYTYIMLVISLFFGLLAVLYLISNVSRVKKSKK